jgi:sugar phosphate isomerase/epimerase
LGIVIYCLGHRQAAMKRDDPRAELFEPMAFLEYCHQLGAGGIQVPLGVRDEPYVRRLRERAEHYGMFLEGIAGPPQQEADVDRFDAEMRTAKLAGVKSVRTVIFAGRRYEQYRSAEEFRRAAERGRVALERAARVVERRRVRLAVENHKDHRVSERLELLRKISSEYVGACVDTGNNLALLEDPLHVVEAFLPWAFSVHLKDQAVQEYEDGFLLVDVPLGEGFLDLQKMIDVLRRARPGICFSLETITRDPLKVPCLTEQYWATLADVAGSDLARILRVARANAAQHFPEVSQRSPKERADLEDQIVKKCLAYARTQLGL